MSINLPIKFPKKSASARTEREKVEARREEVLSKGKRFKYPLQYAKHKLVINTIIISVVAVVALVVAGWVALYRLQDMGDIMYRISTVLPLPVAEVDGKKVRFSDYLMTARSSLTTLEQQSGLENSSEDKTAMQASYKRSALTQTEDLTYALKLGSELGLTVSSEEIATAFDEHRKVGGTERSEESFLKVLETNFGLSKSEYERMLYLNLMRAKVEQAIDKNAESVAHAVAEKLNSNGFDFEKVKDELGDSVRYESTGGLIDNKNVDGGRSGKAASLGVGEVSGKFVSTNGDGYYFVKTLDKTETSVSYVSLFIEFTEFEHRLESLREDGKVKEYIKIPDQKLE